MYIFLLFGKSLEFVIDILQSTVPLSSDGIKFLFHLTIKDVKLCPLLVIILNVLLLQFGKLLPGMTRRVVMRGNVEKDGINLVCNNTFFRQSGSHFLNGKLTLGFPYGTKDNFQRIGFIIPGSFEFRAVGIANRPAFFVIGVDYVVFLVRKFIFLVTENTQIFC